MRVEHQPGRDPEDDRQRGHDGADCGAAAPAGTAARDTARASCGPPRPTSTARRRPRGRAREPRAPAGSTSSPSTASASAAGIVGRHEHRRSLRGHLAEAADVAEHRRLGERQRGREHARLVERSVASTAARPRRRGGRTPAARRRPRTGSRTARRRGACARSGSTSISGTPDDPQLGAVDRAPRLEQHVEPLVGRSSPKNSTTGRSTASQLGRQRPLVRQPR